MMTQHSKPDDAAQPEDDQFANIAPSPWAIEAGLLVVKDGQTLITAKGLAALRAEMELDEKGFPPSEH